MRTPLKRLSAPCGWFAIGWMLATSPAPAQESEEPAEPSESIEAVETIEKKKATRSRGRLGLLNRITQRDEEVPDDSKRPGVLLRITGFVGDRIARVIEKDDKEAAEPDDLEPEKEAPSVAAPAEPEVEPEVLVSIGIEEPFWPAERLAGASTTEFDSSSRAEVESVGPSVEVYVAGFDEEEATREPADSEETVSVSVVPADGEMAGDTKRRGLPAPGSSESSDASPTPPMAAKLIESSSPEPEPEPDQESVPETKPDPEPRGLISTLRLFGRNGKSDPESDPTSKPGQKDLAKAEAKPDLQLNWGSRLRSWLGWDRSKPAKTALVVETSENARAVTVESGNAEPKPEDSEAPSPAGFFAGLKTFFGNGSSSRSESDSRPASQPASKRQRQPGRRPASSAELAEGYMTSTSSTKFFQLSIASRDAQDIAVRRGTVFKVRRAGDHYTQVETASGLTGLMQTELLRAATVQEAGVWAMAAAARVPATDDPAQSGWRPLSTPEPLETTRSEAGSIAEIPPDEVPLGMGLLIPQE